MKGQTWSVKITLKTWRAAIVHMNPVLEKATAVSVLPITNAWANCRHVIFLMM
jgi:hypothetical protein